MRLLSVFCCLVLASFGCPVAAESVRPAAAVLHPLETESREDTRGASAHRVAIMSQGYEALLVRIDLIRSARRSIEVQTFIWANDECGRLLMYELLEAARRGVKVRIVADHLFSEQDPEVVAFLATVHPNLQIKHYRPATSRMKPSLTRTLIAGMLSFRDVNQRMHSKVMIFDEVVLLTGGRNIENTYYDHSDGLNFRDRDVLATGPVVKTAREQFELFWEYRYSIPSRKLVDVDQAIREGRHQRPSARENFDFGAYFSELYDGSDTPRLVAARVYQRLHEVKHAEFLYDAPGKSRRSSQQTKATAQTLRQALERAEQSLLIQTPYLVLSPAAEQMVRQLRSRKSALRIQISTNSFASTDNLFAYSANYRLRGRYVQDLGLHVYETKPHPESLRQIFPRYDTMCEIAARKTGRTDGRKGPFLSLHAKSMVVDGAIGYIGSYNLDPRSENLNTEVGLLVEDETFAQELRAEIEHDMLPGNSWVIAKRRLPLGFDVVNATVDSLLSLTPIDLWPIQNTSSFELLPGAQPVPIGHPEFHQRYREVGSFPGTDGLLSQREIVTRLFKAVGSPLTPIL
jgi:cardiolipin synthase C